MSNHYYTPDDTNFYVKPSRLKRHRKSKWRDRDPELERAIEAPDEYSRTLNAYMEKSNG